MNTARNSHDRGSAIGLALLSSGFIFGWIPFTADANAFGIRRDAREITFRRRDHSVSPVLGHDRDPVSSQIDRGTGLRRRWGSATLPAAASLRDDSTGSRNKEYDGND